MCLSHHTKKNLNKWFVDSRFVGFELICTMNRVRYSDDDDDGGGNNKRNLYSRKNGWENSWNMKIEVNNEGVQ